MKKNIDHFPPEQIRKQLHQLENCDELKKSGALIKILHFVVETTLEGKEEEIKEYTIGVKALGRSRDFNPQLDAIVRIHVTRLRRALSEYYFGAGMNDEIIISIPKGAYIPFFQDNKNKELNYAQPGTEASTVAELKYLPTPPYSRPVLAVLPFHDLSPQPLDPALITALGEDLSLTLAKFDNLSVLSFYTTRNISISRNLKEIKMLTAADCIITGSILILNGAAKINVQLTSISDSSIVWSDSFYHQEVNGDKTHDTFNEIIARIANNVADEHGVINKMNKQFVSHHPEVEAPVPEATQRFKLPFYQKQARGFNRSVA